MSNIHDIDTCIDIFREEGHDVSLIKCRQDITNNNGKLTYPKRCKFQPFDGTFGMFIVALFFSGLFSLAFAEFGVIWSIVAFFVISCLLSPVAFCLDDGWDGIFKYKMLYLGTIFITLILVVMLSYNIHLEHLEYELSLSWNRKDTELVQKYEYLKNLPHWVFHIK